MWKHLKAFLGTRISHEHTHAHLALLCSLSVAKVNVYYIFFSILLSALFALLSLSVLRVLFASLFRSQPAARIACWGHQSTHTSAPLPRPPLPAVIVLSSSRAFSFALLSTRLALFAFCVLDLMAHTLNFTEFSPFVLICAKKHTHTHTQL